MGKRNQYNRQSFPNPIVLTSDLTAVVCNSGSSWSFPTANFTVNPDAKFSVYQPVSASFTGTIDVASMCNGQELNISVRNGFRLNTASTVAGSNVIYLPASNAIVSGSGVLISSNTSTTFYKLDTFTTGATTYTDILVPFQSGSWNIL